MHEDGYFQLEKCSNHLATQTTVISQLKPRCVTRKFNPVVRYHSWVIFSKFTYPPSVFVGLLKNVNIIMLAVPCSL